MNGMRYIRQNFKKHVPMHTRLPMILTNVGESKGMLLKVVN